MIYLKSIPSVSIITPSFNQDKYLRDTIESVLKQNYPSLEHIIIDNCSTDNSLSIIKEYSHLIVISEKDLGPANAINKGMRMARGEVCAWLNSDDYYEADILKDIGKIFAEENVDLLSGNITFIFPEQGNRSDKIKVKPYSVNSLVHDTSDSIGQAGIFFRKDLFWQVGGLDESLKLVFDYDLLIKMLLKGKHIHVDKNIAYQRMYKGTLTKRNLRRQALEILKVSRRNGAHLYDKIILKSVVRKFLFPWIY